MEKKIFRLHEGGITKETGWFKSGIITSEHLKTIRTEGKDVATSIPTPFATIDLVKSAFRWLSENNINGSTAQHQLVSDAFDVAQLFFNSPKLEDKIQIVAFNPKDRFAAMIQSGSKTHKKFSETLDLFWEQDSLTGENSDDVLYNFESTNRLYFLINKENNRIIGGTSPATLFFASPDVRKVTKGLDVTLGKKLAFDNNFSSLAERDLSFIKYIYTLSKQNNFSTYFPEVYEYLEKVKEHLKSELRREITQIEAIDIDNYEDCKVLNNENDVCEILNIPLRVESTDTSSISSESDFVLKSDYTFDRFQPLILPQYPFSKKWTYTFSGIEWNENTEIPYRNMENRSDSKLPVQNDSYYWLTLGNFLEDKIFKLPYRIDDTKFVTCGGKNYLLPLSSTFFEYFKAESIPKMISMKERSGGNIDVELKIPVKAGTIQFTKQYSLNDKNIVELETHLAIYPFIKSDHFKINQIIGVLDDRSDKSKEIELFSIKSGKKEVISNAIVRNKGLSGELLSKYYKVENQPDVYGITIDNNNAFIIPILNSSNETRKVELAIDFGTTNTHIEYRYEGRDSQPLDNKYPSSLIQSLMLRDNNVEIDPQLIENEKTFEEEILPFSFASDENLSFPVRSALVYNGDIDFSSTVEVFQHVNNYLLLEKRKVQPHLEVETQKLKWSNYANETDELKVELYIEFLITIAFHKILQIGGNPNISSVTWFYPVSMDEAELGVLFKLWNKVYNKIFKQEGENNLIGMPESIAPYLYYKSTVEGLCLSVDIGGGSSDIAVFDESEKSAILISSIKFAGNAVFGDGYPIKEFENNSDQNGFVKLFKQAGLEAVKNDIQKSDILNKILEDSKNSADFSSYLFALEQENSSFSYTRLLEKDDKIKLSFLVFYAAIAYYSANLLEKAGIKIPKYILLSGTASKSASILDTSEDLKNLSEMFLFIFNKVYKSERPKTLRIKRSNIPKEITCKGALKARIDSSVKETPIKFWIGGKHGGSWGKVLDKQKDIGITPKYGDIGENEKLEIEKTLEDFYTILDEYINSTRLQAKYFISPNAVTVFKDLRSESIKEFLVRGLRSYYKKEETRIEESLFFYPLIGVLNKLSFALAEKDIQDA